MRAFFARLSEHVLSQTKEAAPEVKAFFPVDDWSSELAKELTPVIRAALTEGGTGILSQIGGIDVPTLPVLQLEAAAKLAAKKLAESTLETTNLALEAAHQAVRDAVAAGLAAGEANAQLTDRIQAVFTSLTEEHCVLIAETESAAAKHQGELIAIRESGVECRKKWLADALCCDKCAALNGKEVELDEPFHDDGKGGPYSVTDHPPKHPRCRCTLLYLFPDDEA